MAHELYPGGAQRSGAFADNAAQHYWFARARRCALKVNLGWWLHLFLPASLVLAILFACVLLIARSRAEISSWYWAGFAALLLAAAAACFFGARRKFFSESDGLARLDITMKLCNRLTAASSGVGCWPAPQETDDKLDWRWPVLLSPLLMSVSLLAFAWLVPIRRVDAPSAPPVAQPVSWDKTQSLIEALEEQKLLAPEALEKLQHQLEELRKQPAEQWYDHGSLEAGDALRRQLEAEIQTLVDELKRADQALSELGRGAGADPGARGRLEQQLGRSRDALGTGSMPLDKQMLDRLGKAAEEGRLGGSRGDIETLREELNRSRRELERSLKSGPGGERRGEAGKSGRPDGTPPRNSVEQSDGSKSGRSSDGADSAKGRPGGRQGGDEPGKGTGQGQGGRSPGAGAQDGSGNRSPGRGSGNGTEGGQQGGISRGPGTAPLEKSFRDRLNLNSKLEEVPLNIKPEDPASDLKLLTEGAPEVDRSKAHGLLDAGEDAPHEGEGKAVWKGAFTPEEREVLQRVFK